MYTLTEITSAIKVIKDVCGAHYHCYHCEDCPLRDSKDDCAIMASPPKEWELYDPKNIRLIL